MRQAELSRDLRDLRAGCWLPTGHIEAHLPPVGWELLNEPFGLYTGGHSHWLADPDDVWPLGWVLWS